MLAFDALLLISLWVFEYWEISTRKVARDRAVFFPWWVFPIVWFVLKLLMVLSTFFYWRDHSANVDVALVSLYFANGVLRKYWSVAFMDYNQSGIALVLAFFIAGTAIALVTMYGIQGLWLSFGLALPLAIWCTIAIGLNWVYIKRQKKQTGNKNLPFYWK
jgi:tryptophan-rich sensory protein